MGFQVRFNCCELSWSVVSRHLFLSNFNQNKFHDSFFFPRLWSAETRLSRSRFCSGLDLRFEQLFKQHCDKLDFQANWLRNLFSQAHTCLLLKKTLNMSLSLFLPLSSLFLCQLGNKQNGIWSTNKGDILGKRGDSHKKGFHSNWQPAHFPSLKMLKRIHTRGF